MAKQRQVRMDNRSGMAHMERLETRSDDELAGETRYRSAAQAILGARAAERMDAARAREHYRQAIASARPQERLQLRRMAEASLALAERRTGDLKVAAQKLGQAPPSNRMLWALKIMGLISPGPGSSAWLKARGVLIVLAAVAVVLALGVGLIKLIALPFGGLDTSLSIFWGFVLVMVVFAVLIVKGRKRQKKAAAEAAANRAAQLDRFR